MNPQRLSSSLRLRSLKTRFAIRFLRALKKISNQKSIPPPSSSPSTVRRRCRMIKTTADASMASAVGPQRAWSRAVLLKLRWRTRSILTRAPVVTMGIKKRKRRAAVPDQRKVQSSGFFSGEEDQLRKLVPGGEVMDTHNLLDETAHYIKCLTTQVMVMRSIVNYCSI